MRSISFEIVLVERAIFSATALAVLGSICTWRSMLA